MEHVRLTPKEVSILIRHLNHLLRIVNQLDKIKRARVMAKLHDVDGHEYAGDIDCAIASIEMILQDFDVISDDDEMMRQLLQY